jgi:hypothetical protein
MVAEEISSGIDRALQYWLGRIELEVVDRSLSTAERIDANRGNPDRVQNKDRQGGVRVRLGLASSPSGGAMLKPRTILSKSHWNFEDALA